MFTHENPWTPDEVATMKEMRRQHVSWPKIGRVLGRTKEAVRRCMEREIIKDQKNRRASGKDFCRQCQREVYLGRFERWCATCRSAISAHDHPLAI